MRTLKLVALLGLCGCASFNTWFDRGVTPPRDALWMTSGAVFDAGLQFAKVPFGWRVVADATAASLIRLTPWFGKNLDSGFDFMVTASAAEIIGLFVRKHS